MRLSFLMLAFLTAAGAAIGLLIVGLPTYATAGIFCGALILYLAFSYPAAIVVFLTCLVPFNILWMGGGVSVIEAIYSLTYLALVVVWLLKRAVGMVFKGEASSLWSPAANPAAAFLAAAVLSCIIGALRGNKPLDWASVLNAFSFYGLCFILPDAVKNKRALHILASLMGIAMFLGLLKAIYVGFTMPYVTVDFLGQKVPRLREASEPALFMFMISLAFMLTLEKGRKKTIFTFFTFFLGAMQIASLVRSRWIAAVIGIAFLLFVSTWRHKTGVMRFVLGALVLSLLYYAAARSFPSGHFLYNTVSTVEKRCESIFSAKDEPSITSRGSEWQEATKKGLAHPFLGNGLGTEITYYRYDRWYGAPMWQTTRYIHNSYIFLFLNMGLVGLALFFWLSASVITYSLRLYGALKDGADKALALGIAAGFVSVLVASFAEPLVSAPWLTMWLGFFIGALAILDRARGAVKDDLR